MANNSLVKLALLIDAENFPAKFLDYTLARAAELGTVAIARVYGHFDSPRMSGWNKALDVHPLLAKVEVARISKAKNASDFALIVQAMDMLHSRGLDGICIASSDGDFAALTQRIRAGAVSAYGFGTKKAPETYRRTLDAFIDCEAAAEKKPARRATAKQLQAATPPAKAAPKIAPPAARPEARTAARPARKVALPPKPATASATPALRDAIVAAIEAARNDDGWSHLGGVNNQLKKAMPDFTPRKFGVATFKKLIERTMGAAVEFDTMPGGAARVRLTN